MNSDFSPPPPSKLNPRVRRVLNVFAAGFAAVIPIIGTIWLVKLIYQLLLEVGDRITAFFVKAFMVLRGEDINGKVVIDFPGDDAFRLILPVLLLLGIGFILTNRLGKSILQWFNRTVRRIPVLGFIYSTLSQFVDAVRGLGGDQKFKGVAYVEYPSPGSRLIGFITGNYHDVQTGKGVTTIFIPTSPNPMTGFVVIMDDDKVFKSDMSLEEASKMILSAGLVAPESFADDMNGVEKD